MFGIALEKDQNFATPSLVSSREMTSEERAQKFHTDDVSVPGYGLVVTCGKFDSTNQMHNGVLGNVASSVWNFSARFPDAISRESSGGVAKFGLFSQALFWTMDSPLI